LLYRLLIEDGTIFIVYLSRGFVARCCFFYPFVDGSFELCNNWLCTSPDVEAGFNYPISKKSMYVKFSALEMATIFFLCIEVPFVNFVICSVRLSPSVILSQKKCICDLRVSTNSIMVSFSGSRLGLVSSLEIWHLAHQLSSKCS
jgi:hypothetical protein